MILPIQSLFSFNYLGNIESEINTLNYYEAQENFVFDYYNLNPMEDLENKKKNIKENNPLTFLIKSRNGIINMLENQKNQLNFRSLFSKLLTIRPISYMKLWKSITNLCPKKKFILKGTFINLKIQEIENKYH